MDNEKVPRDSVVVPEESRRHRGSSRTNLQVPVVRLKSLKFSKSLHSAKYDNYDTMRLNRDEEDKELWLRVR